MLLRLAHKYVVGPQTHDDDKSAPVQVSSVQFLDRHLTAIQQRRYTGRAATDRFVRAHGEQVSHERREAWSKAALSDEAQLELGQTDRVVTTIPVPRRHVQQVRLHRQQYHH